MKQLLSFFLCCVCFLSGLSGVHAVQTKFRIKIIDPSLTTLEVSGHGYPNTIIGMYLDGQLVTKGSTNSAGEFRLYTKSLSSGSHSVELVYMELPDFESRLATLPVTLTIVAGSVTELTQVLMPPVVLLDTSKVDEEGLLVFEGQSVPNTEVAVFIKDPDGDTHKWMVDVDENGEFRKAVTIAMYGFGVYDVRAQSKTIDNLSIKSGIHRFKYQDIQTENQVTQVPVATITPTVSRLVSVLKPVRELFSSGDDSDEEKGCLRGDLNCDGLVNIQDISIAQFWKLQQLTVENRVIEKERLNGDARITMQDYSIMAYYWSD